MIESTQMTKRTFAASAILVALLMVTGCATNPATGKKQISLIGEANEIQMGREADQQIVAQMGLYGDQELQSYVSNIGLELAAASERPELPWTFRVVDDPVVNAFALPGGFIYITRGILAHMSSEAELAAVLGHEIGHVTARHSVNQMSKSQLLNIGLIAGMIAAPETQRYADLVQTGLGLMTLKFSRDDERQADELGLRYLTREDYDPHQMPRVFEMLGRVSAAASEGGRVPGWMSTHPDPGQRQQTAQQAISQLEPSAVGTKVDRPEFLAAIDDMIFGPNPREGFFREQRFMHPDMAFEVTFPTGWKTANQKQRVIAGGSEQNAIMQLTLSQEASKDAALTTFMGQEGLQPGRTWRDTINGLSAVGGAFSAQSQERKIVGRVTYVSYGDNMYQLLAYGLEQPFLQQDRAIVSAMTSFKRLTEKKALAVQPHRIDITKLDRPLTVAQVQQQAPSAVPTDILAMINAVTPAEQMPSGFSFKRVVGEPF